MDLTSVTPNAADILLKILLRPENVYLMVAVYALISTVQKVLPPSWGSNHISARLAPLYPLILCSIGVWVPGQQPDDVGAGSRILVGLILGWACGHSHKVWKQTLWGKDARIEARKQAKQSNQNVTS